MRRAHSVAPSAPGDAPGTPVPGKRGALPGTFPGTCGVGRAAGLHGARGPGGTAELGTAAQSSGDTRTGLGGAVKGCCSS